MTLVFAFVMMGMMSVKRNCCVAIFYIASVTAAATFICEFGNDYFRAAGSGRVRILLQADPRSVKDCLLPGLTGCRANNHVWDYGLQLS